MELATIFGIEKDLVIGEATVKIKQVELGNLATVLDIIETIFEMKSKKAPGTKEILSAVTNHFDKVLKLLEVTTDLGAENVKRLNVAAATLILSEVIKENSDFFSQKVVPLLQGIAETVQAKQPGPSKSKG